MFKIENKKSFFQGIITSGVILFLLALCFYYGYPLVQNPFPPITCIKAPCPQMEKIPLSSFVKDGPMYIQSLNNRVNQLNEKRVFVNRNLSECLRLIEENNVLACKSILTKRILSNGLQ